MSDYFELSNFDHNYLTDDGDVDWDKWDKDAKDDFQRFKEREDNKLTNRLSRFSGKLKDKVKGVWELPEEEKMCRDFVLRYDRKYDRL